jgi:hypothetical protein
MPQITLRPKGEVIATAMVKFADDSIKGLQDAIFDEAEKAQAALIVPGDPPPRRIPWKSKRQAIAFHSSDGFGQGIPTVRSHRHRLGWQLERKGMGVLLYNNVPNTSYITGDAFGKGASQIHYDRWQSFRGAVTNMLYKMPDELFELMRKIMTRMPSKW